MNKYKGTILFLLLSSLLIVIDQITKLMVVRTFELHTGTYFINDFFGFFYTRNTGSAFSFLADKSWGIYVLSAFSLVLSVVVLFFLIKATKANEKLVACALTLLLSGAVGNLIDRFRLHYVIDFIRFDFGSKTFPIFNVADICAVLGTIMLIIIMIFLPDKADKVW